MDKQNLNQDNAQKEQENVLRGINNPALLDLLNKINDAISELKDERAQIATSRGYLAKGGLFAPFFPGKIKTREYSELRQIDGQIEKLEKLHDKLSNAYDEEQQLGKDDDDEKEIEDDDEKEFEYEPWD